MSRKVTQAATVALVAVSLSFAGGVSCSMAEETPLPVFAVEARSIPLSLDRTFVGTIVARSTVDMAFEVPGRLLDVHGTVGAVLAEGSPIAELDPAPYALALDRERVQTAQSAAALQRTTQLNTRGINADTALEETKTAFDLQRIAERSAERDLGLTVLHAPFDAMIAQRLAEENALIQPGVAVVRLHDVGEWRVELAVSETLMRRGFETGTVRIEAVIDQATASSVPLVYREHEAEPDAVTRTYLVTFAATLPLESNLLPGMSVPVRVQVAADQALPGVIVPVSAVVTEPDGALRIWRVEEGKAVPTPVAAGEVADGGVHILEGIDAGDIVITAGQNALREDQPVRPLTGG
jgi:RND family efflux transporter MFP subunit